MGTIYKDFALDIEGEAGRLNRLPFKECAMTISKMDLMTKASIAAEINVILKSEYEAIQIYGVSTDKATQMSPDTFNFIMKKIERWETVLYWLYEIDVLMQETPLDTLIRQAETKIAKSGNDELHRFTMQEVMVTEDNGNIKFVKRRVAISVQQELDELKAKRDARGIHTDEIMAAALTAKYNRGDED